MRVALVKSPNLGNTVRGAGYYVSHLAHSLANLVDVSVVEFSFSPTAYSGLDVVHFAYFDEYFFTLPPFLPKNTVLTVLDCTKLRFPEHFPRGLRAGVAWPWQRVLARQAAHIITISQSAKDDISHFFAIPKNKITVTYLSADPVFQPIKTERKNFALYVGGVNWNKNIINLVKACQKTKTPLVLVGKEFVAKNVDWENVENRPLKAILEAVRSTTDIKFFGFVEPEELVKVYNQAKVYIQPSIYEGFGLPILEAMACGTPVICGRNSSLPEIAGNAATYADVESVDDLADKISHIAATGKEIAQAAKFSWEKTAKKTYEVYQKVLASS